MGFQIKYKHLMISLIAFFMVIFVIDRFTTNIWPWYFTKSSPIEDIWSASTYFIIGWICGRELIVASSFIWLLQCRCLWNWVSENKPKWLIVDDIMVENNHMHYHLGWAAIAVPMVVHTWLALLPLVQGIELTVHPTWYRPIDHEVDPVFFEETYHKHHLQVSISDLVALVLLTITFLGLFPIAFSKKVRGPHFSCSQYMHQLAALIYGIELLRTPFTAHCWFICTPFICAYIIDRALATFYYRYTDKARVVCQYNFDDKYFLLCLWVPDIYYHITENTKGTHRSIGDVFWLNTKGFVYRKIPQPAHPFTSFYNHNNVIPNINDFLKSQEERQNLSHPSHKFQISKRRAVDEAVGHHDVGHNQKTSYILGRKPTVDPHSKTNSKLGRMISLSQQISDPQQSITTTIDEDEEDDDGGTTTKINKKPPMLQNTSSLFVHGNDIELSQLAEQDTLQRKETLKSWQWNIGFIIRVHERNDKYGFTERIAKRKAIKDESDDNYMMTYGPYRSSFANIMDFINETPGKGNSDFGAIILIATGAGVGYIIETVLYLLGKFKGDKKYKLHHQIRIHFSGRSIRLFQWVTDFLADKKIENVKVFANLTSKKNIYGYKGDENDDHASSAQIGRANVKNELKDAPNNSKVFFCGHPRIQSDIKEICKELNFTFYEGHSFG